jgi:SAM-dependent methyltransferase
MPERWPAWIGPLWRFVDRHHRGVRRTLVGLGDGRRIRRKGLTMIPPARLRDRVHGKPDVRAFVRAGERAKGRLEAALDSCDLPLDSFTRILDFGCGCGRVLRWLEPIAEGREIHGTDVDRKAVEWCAANIPFARFRVNGPLPPLPYGDGAFDLVYSISVLTHLDEERQVRWLEELRRVTAPGGIVVVTVMGDGILPELREDERHAVRERGMVFIRTGRWRGMFPDWYQVTVHRPDYARELFSRFFELVAYLPGGLSEQQDFAVLRRPALNPG